MSHDAVVIVGTARTPMGGFLGDFKSVAAPQLGAAYAFMLRRDPRAAVCFIGDGGTSNGAFYEALNMAGVWKTPLAIVINNNRWAISTPREQESAAETLAQKGIAAGVEGRQVDGNDVLAVHHVALQAIEKARSGGGATLIEAVSYRLGDHTTADDATRYRDPDIVRQEWAREPIVGLRAYLIKSGLWSKEQETALLTQCGDEVEKAVKTYLETPAPESDAIGGVMKTFRLPDLGEGLQEAEIVAWLVKAGEDVAADQPMLSVETAKAVVEIPAPRAGRVERVFANAGDIIRVGAPLLAFEGASDAGEDSGTVVGAVQTGGAVLREAPIAEGRVGGAIRATPAVRALARKLDVDLAMVTPSGADGAILAEDVQRVARILSESEPAEPLRGVRRAMAQNMALAQAEVAAATIMDDADINAWAPVTDVTARLIRALVAGCRAEPLLNAWFESHSLGLRVLHKIDLGIAVDMPEGLFVPVLRDVGSRDPADLRSGLDRMRAGEANVCAFDDRVGARRIFPRS